LANEVKSCRDYLTSLANEVKSCRDYLTSLANEVKFCCNYLTSLANEVKSWHIGVTFLPRTHVGLSPAGKTKSISMGKLRNLILYNP
jgi:hypothetical protein